MRRSLLAVVFSLVLGTFVAPLRAAPILTIDLRIGTVTTQIGLFEDLSLRFCDGSVLVACDGSVRILEGASFRLSETGVISALTSIEMLGDGSVRVFGDGSVMPSDSLRINVLSASPNPFINAAVSVIDNDAPTSFGITFGVPLILSGSTYQYALTGDIAIDGSSATAAPALGSGNILSGLVDNLTVAGIGGLAYTEGLTDLGTDSGMTTCSSCSLLGAGVAFAGSGGGAAYVVKLNFDVDDAVAIPTPGSLALLAIGLLGILSLPRRSITQAAPARAS